MRCVAVIEAQRPGLDSVIIWDNQDQLVAYAYEDGKVKMTRPLAATGLDEAADEVRVSFQINAAQFTRITDWNDAQSRIIAPTRTRW